MLSFNQKRRLKQIFGSDNALFRSDECLAYSYDNSDHRVVPKAVLFAQKTDQVHSLIRYANQWRIPITCRGRGTGTAGAAVATPGGIILSFERMNRILSIQPADRLAVVQPGVSNQILQNELARYSFFWPPDPTSSSVCTIGGNLACNAAGPRTVKYGSCRENTLALTAITGAGERIHTGTYTTKGVVGYDLTRLLIGSEGTLAVITEAVLKLSPLAESKRTLQAIYPDLESATEAVSALMAQPIIPSALELMDQSALKMAQSFAGIELPEQAAALLMIEVEDQNMAIEYSSQKIAAIAARNSLSVQIAKDANKRKQLWRLRKSLSPALRHIAPKKINEDVVVPVSKIPQLVKKIQHLSEKYQLKIVNFGHAGNGNLHVNLLIDPKNEQQARAAQSCLQQLFDYVLQLNGSLSGEHGIGWVKKKFVPKELGQAELALLKQIKAQFDPNGILNPDKHF